MKLTVHQPLPQDSVLVLTASNLSSLFIASLTPGILLIDKDKKRLLSFYEHYSKKICTTFQLLYLRNGRMIFGYRGALTLESVNLPFNPKYSRYYRIGRNPCIYFHSGCSCLFRERARQSFPELEVLV